MEGLPIHQNTLKKNHNPNNYSPFLKISTTTVVFTAALHRNSLQFSMCGVFVLFVFFFWPNAAWNCRYAGGYVPNRSKVQYGSEIRAAFIKHNDSQTIHKATTTKLLARMFVFFSHTKKMSLYYKMIQTECFCFIKLIVKFNFLFW